MRHKTIAGENIIKRAYGRLRAKFGKEPTYPELVNEINQIRTEIAEAKEWSDDDVWFVTQLTTIANNELALVRKGLQKKVDRKSIAIFIIENLLP